ncbi:Mitogen-activated protein kinase kinase [Paramyrothecium foliicola]|nr:Mitogen-activated protein kinase kinase [Paramyrothecium foliicola]
MSHPSTRAQMFYHQFLEYTKDLHENGLTCDGHIERYLPHSVLTDHWTIARIKELLDSFGVFQAPDLVRSRYLRVLSILVSISGTVGNSVYYLELLISHFNDDFSLPWTSMPRGLETVSGSGALFAAFFQAQWKFCPVLLDLAHNMSNTMSNTNLNRRSIFPFTQMETINSGRTPREGTVKIMDVHAIAHRHLDSKDHTPARAALKIYPPGHEGEYENERRAFGALNRRSPNIVQCLGSFTWLSEDKKRTSTLILEHATYGTLLDLFTDNKPPYTTEDIKTMWLGVLGIPKGLEVVHEQLKSVHQDLKPSNILIFPSENIHDITSRLFKIADFGATNGRVDRRATRTYCPPELHLNDEIRYTVQFGVDMWALGCILMEIAVWISFGERGRQDFRQQRMQETSYLPDHEDLGRADCFHDGSKVLDCVSKIPELIELHGRKGDNITLQMVHLILYHLLVEEDGRCQPKDLYVKMKNVIRGTQSPLSMPGFNLRNSSATSHEVASPRSFVGSPTSISMSPIAEPSSSASLPYTPRIDSSGKSTTVPTEASGLIVQSATDARNQFPNIAAPNPTSRPPHTSQPLQHVQAKTVMTRAFPHLPISDLEEWIKVEKRTPGAQSLSGWEAAKNQLKDRDFADNDAQVFLIDNSSSMQSHKVEVLRFVRSLSYLVKELDPDGLQVLRTSNPQRKETCRTATRAFEVVERTFLEGRSGSKPTTIIIFTDGVWNPSVDGLCGVDGPIEQCIQTMKHHAVDRPYVSLQFLRFGTQSIGERRLRSLDDDLKTKAENQNFDIVDHKPTTAGIWDILVGSVSQDVDE